MKLSVKKTLNVRFWWVYFWQEKFSKFYALVATCTPRYLIIRTELFSLFYFITYQISINAKFPDVNYGYLFFYVKYSSKNYVINFDWKNWWLRFDNYIIQIDANIVTSRVKCMIFVFSNEYYTNDSRWQRNNFGVWLGSKYFHQIEHLTSINFNNTKVQNVM